jgi:hypothetical protein
MDASLSAWGAILGKKMRVFCARMSWTARLATYSKAAPCTTMPGAWDAAIRTMEQGRAGVLDAISSVWMASSWLARRVPLALILLHAILVPILSNATHRMISCALIVLRLVSQGRSLGLIMPTPPANQHAAPDSIAQLTRPTPLAYLPPRQRNKSRWSLSSSAQPLP